MYKLNENEIKKYLKTKCEIYFFEEIDSTNTYLKTIQPHGKAVAVACKQTAGRGRRGRTWVSEEGNIYLSVSFEFEGDAENAPFCGICAAVAAAQVLEDCGLCVKIKWPNDIVCMNKKIAGILPEIFMHDGKTTVVIGIGMNVGQTEFPDEINIPATSVAAETKTQIDINKITSQLADKIFELCDKRSGVIDLYKDLCVNLNREVCVNGEYTAEAVDVTADGRLTVIKNGEILHLGSGEVSIRGVYGYI